MLQLSTRLSRRLVRHHVVLLLISVALITGLYFTRPYRDPLTRASFATAYPALGLLTLTLLTGPFRILRRGPSPVSDDLRRDVGIWAGILTLLHVAIGQNVHLRGRPWLYYVYAAPEHHAFPLRHDWFGWANHTGAASTVVVLLLLLTSNDVSLRRFRTRPWKRLQRWNYAAFALAAVHTMLYQRHEKLNTAFPLAVGTGIVLTLALQFAAYTVRRRASRPSLVPVG